MTLQVEAATELYIDQLVSEHYRWWRFMGRWLADERTAKLGPVTISLCRYVRWRVIVTIFGRFTLYDGVLREMRRREYT